MVGRLRTLLVFEEKAIFESSAVHVAEPPIELIIVSDLGKVFVSDTDFVVEPVIKVPAFRVLGYKSVSKADTFVVK